MIELLKNTNIDFMKLRKIAYFISIVLILNGLYSLFLVNKGKARMGLDFTGGSSIQIKFSKDITVEKIRQIAEKNNIKQLTIQQIGKETDKEFLIRAGTGELQTGKASEQLVNMFKSETGDNEITVVATNEIGPIVSTQLKQKAFLAMFWASIGILIYIWIRFKFKFAVAATIATLHDVIVVFGLLVFMKKELDLLIITALLTLAGYSLTDTVVVFDRIRENLRNILKFPFIDIVNKSINEVLSRTIITSGTTLLVVIALFFWGGDVLHNFSLALLLGIIVGTYSSIFVASAIIVDWEIFEKKRLTKK